MQIKGSIIIIYLLKTDFMWHLSFTRLNLSLSLDVTPYFRLEIISSTLTVYTSTSSYFLTATSL